MRRTESFCMLAFVTLAGLLGPCSSRADDGRTAVASPPSPASASQHTSVSALKAYIGQLKARKDQRRLGYWDTLLAQLAVRAYPEDTIDPGRWLTARLHRDRMSAAPRQSGARTLAVGADWRFVGPKNLTPTAMRCFGPTAVSGNVLAAAYHPSTPGLYYIGSAGGGLWKTTDYGVNWTPLSENWAAMAVACIAIHPTDPNTIYVGIGQWNAWQCHPSGIWRSTNGGTTWTNISPPNMETHLVRTIAIDPDNPDIVMFGTGQIGGNPGKLYRSTNGGDSWSPRLTAVSARWDEIKFAIPDGGGHRACFVLGEKGNGYIYSSSNSGDTWTAGALPFTAGAGDHQDGLSMTCSATDPTRIYVVSGRDKSIQRSSFLGQAGTWTDITGVMATQFEGNWYQYGGDLTLACTQDTSVPPAHDVLYLGLVCLFQSRNADSNWREFSFDNQDTKAHVDQHAIAFNPTNPNEMLFTNDGGVYRALWTPASDTWTIASLNADLEVTQFYRMAAHPTDVNCALGGTQDNATPAWCGPDRKWMVQGAGDGTMGAISPSDPDVRYSAWLNGGLQVTASGWNGPNPEITPNVGTDRRSMFVPIAADPNDSTALYYGTNYLWRFDRSGTGGSWVPRLGGVELAGPDSTLSYIAVAPSDSNTIYTGSHNGQVWVSKNRGTTWREIDNTTSPLPDRGITYIAVHPTNPNYVLVAVGGTSSAHSWRCNNTSVAAPVWQDIDGDADGTARLPDIHAVAIVFDLYDPDSSYFLANDVGVFATMDAGHHWANAGLPLGLPNAQPTDLAVASGSKNLFVSTYGRGIWRMQLRSSGILIQEPNAHVQIEQGELLQVKWVSKGKPGTTCDLWLWEGTHRIRSIATGLTTSAGYYDWHIPADETLREDCRIEVVTSGGYSDDSDAGFDIIERTAIDVTQPTSGYVWIKGSTQQIRWTYTGIPGSRVKIELMHGGSVLRTIASSAILGSSGAGSCAWKMPVDQNPDDDYQIRVTDTSDPTHTDTGPYFEVADATAIEVTTPTGEDVWHMGTMQTIRWQYSGSPGAMIGIKLYRSGALVRSIVGMMSIGSGGSGSYDWTLPDDLTPNSGYVIRVGNEITTGESDQFAIAAVRCRMRVDDASGRIAYPVNLRTVLTNWYTGDPLVGFAVRFRIYDTDIGGATTNASGDGRLTYTLPDTRTPTTYALYADYAGDATHSPISDIGSLSITKGIAIAFAASASGFATENIELWGRLYSQPNSAAIVGRTLRFSVDGTIVMEQPTDDNGSVRFPYRIPELAPGAHTITAAFDGDTRYEAASDTDTLTVRKCDTFLMPRSVSGQIGETVTLSASLTRQGDLFPLVGRQLVFRVSGAVVGTGATDFEGQAGVPYTIPTSLGVGGKTYQVEYAGETCYVAHTQIGALTVSKADTAVAVENVSARTGEVYVAKGRLTRLSDGAPLEGKVVVFAYDGYTIGQGTTDADGRATVQGIAFEGISVGDHVLLGTYAGDVLHKAGSGDGTLTIGKAGTRIWTIARSGIITESVILRAYDLRRTSDNQYLEARTIAFKIDGTTIGTGTTNDSGDAILTWTVAEGAASRTITVEFAGTDYYDPCSATSTLTCVTWATKMAGFDRTARIAARTELKARLLRSDNVPLYNKPVDFSVDGTFVITRPTDTQGYARYPNYDVPDGAGSGARTILSSWAGNGGYLAISKTATLTVLKALPYIWILPKTVAHGAKVSMYAYFRRLYDYQKQAGKTVTFLVDGTFIASAVTDGGGVARYMYQTVEAVGDHTIRCEFAGDAWVEAGYGEGLLRVY